jgi:hypothetical protein
LERARICYSGLLIQLVGIKDKGRSFCEENTTKRFLRRSSAGHVINFASRGTNSSIKQYLQATLKSSSNMKNHAENLLLRKDPVAPQKIESS